VPILRRRRILGSTSRRCILLVEDSSDLVEIWSRLFTASGFEVVACANCKEALANLANGHDFDMVVSDYYLPDYSGLVLFDHIRKTRPDIPFLLVTGTRETFIHEHLKRGGRAEVIGKPVMFKDLLNKVNQFLPSAQ
jgi:CheY-like chemotaxis protein